MNKSSDNLPEWSEQELELLALVRGDKPKDPEPEPQAQEVAPPKPVVEAEAPAPLPTPEPVQEKPKLPAKRAERSYTEEQRERGLTALAVLGSSRQAEETTGIPEATLRSWRRTQPERYAQIREQQLGQIQKRMVVEFEDLASRYAEEQHATLDKFNPDAIPAKDIPGALRNLSTAHAIATDKAQLLRGNPTSIVEKRTGEEIVDAIAAKWGHLAVEHQGEVEEIEDAQLAA